MKVAFINISHLIVEAISVLQRWLIKPTATRHLLRITSILLHLYLLRLQFEGRIALPCSMSCPPHDIPWHVDHLAVGSFRGVAVLGSWKYYFVLERE